MRQWEQEVRTEVQRFETLFQAELDKPLEIKPVWDGLWTGEEKNNCPPLTWKELAGVYLFADVCDEKGNSSDVPDHYSVIQYVGETDNFVGRFKKYCHPKWQPITYYKTKKTKEWRRWFRYRWIDIIPFDAETAFLRGALETFLLAKIHPMKNTKGVPIQNAPRVFDEGESQSPCLERKGD